MSEFEDLKPFPGEEAPPPLHHNRPPLDEQVALDFDEAVRGRGLDARVREIAEQADKAPEIDSNEVAGLAGDLIAMARAAADAVEAERETLNRPLLIAQRSLKARADVLVAPMSASVGALRKRLDAYMAETDAVVRGDMGSRVGRQTSWDFRIVDVAKVPVDIRCHPEVLDAMKKVIASRVRSGTRTIAGVDIFPTVRATVR